MFDALCLNVNFVHALVTLYALLKICILLTYLINDLTCVMHYVFFTRINKTNRPIEICWILHAMKHFIEKT